MAARTHEEQRKRPHARSRRTRAACWLLLAAFLLTAASCRTTVIPPIAPADPVVVHLLHHGRHTSLVLPREDGMLIRYSYGDWRFYALARDGIVQGAAALLWPTPSCLGRREIGRWSPGEDPRSEFERRSMIGIRSVSALTVDRRAVKDLQHDLESLFEQGRGGLFNQPAHHMEFVPHPERYHLFRNSNTMIARWLRALDCDVRGAAIISRWNVREARPALSAATESGQHAGH